MSEREYQRLLKKLYSLSRFHTEKIGLRNILQLNSYLSHPVREIPIVHIAGTNGKVRVLSLREGGGGGRVRV